MADTMSDPTQEKEEGVNPTTTATTTDYVIPPHMRPLLHKNKLFWMVECYCPYTDNGYAIMYFKLELYGKRFEYPSSISSSAHHMVGGDYIDASEKQWLPGVIKKTHPWAIRISLTNCIDFKCELPLAKEAHCTSSMSHQKGDHRLDFGGVKFISLSCREEREEAPSFDKRFYASVLFLDKPFFTPEVVALVDKVTEPIVLFQGVASHVDTLKRSRDDWEDAVTRAEEVLRYAKRMRDEHHEEYTKHSKIVAAYDTADFFEHLRPGASELKRLRLRLVTELEHDYDHVVMAPATIAHYAEAFGCEIKTRSYPAVLLFDPTDDQGLASELLAETLCDHFGIRYDTKIGRGSQLRECCAKLKAYFEKQGL